MSFIKRITGKKDNPKVDQESKDTWGMFRPVEPDFLSRGVNDIARMPTIPFVGFRFCVDDMTEILTDGGWKLFKDLGNERVATRDIGSGKVDYVVPTEKIAYHYKGEMVNYDTKGLSFSVIPEHNMVVAVNESKDFGFVRAKDLFHNRYHVKRDFGNWDGIGRECYVVPSYDIEHKNLKRKVIEKREAINVPMDAWLDFIGWWFAEGHCSDYEVGITQKKSKYKLDIEKVMNGIGIDWSYKKASGQYVINSVQLASHLRELYYVDGEKRIPRLYFDLSKRQIRILLDSYYKGDGTKATKGGKCYFSVYYGLASDIQEMILKCGSCCSLKKNNRPTSFSNKKYVYIVNEWKSNRDAIIQTKKIRKEHYDGMVYCVNVEPYHTIFVRRNGTVMWTGNCYDLYQYSDLLRTILRNLVHETFRNGLIIQKVFVNKCNHCGAEYNTATTSCDVCGSNDLREPDRSQYEFLREWRKKVNYNDQDLIEVLKEVDMDVNIIDNAFLAVLKRYDFDVEGKVVGAHPIELVRAHPERTNFVFDKNGVSGRADDGRVVLTCLEHRDKHYLKKDEEVEAAKCEKCGKKLYPVYFRSTKMGSKYIYYTKGEIMHFKKFSYGIGYGLPAMFSVWQKVQILMKMDFFMLSAYSLERPPKGILMMKGNRESIDKAWRRLQEEARTNPHMIYPLVVEGSKDIKNVMEWLDLTLKSDDINFIEFRDELRRTVGALWGVMPIFHGDTSAGMGLANEGLQVLVTNRAVETEQAIFNDKVFPWICKEIGVTDWCFKCVPNEGRDVVARLQREQLRIQNAQAMVGMGYIAEAVKTEDGIDFEIKDPETLEDVPATERMTMKRPMSTKRMQRFEGEPEHGRPKQNEQQGGDGGTEGIRNSKSQEASGSNAGAAMASQKSADIKKEDVNWFTAIVDDDDLDVLKSGWNKAVAHRFEGIAASRFGALEIADFWKKYSGLSIRKSRVINGIIYKAVLERNTNEQEIVKEIVDRTGLASEKADVIVRTELANIALEARELAYKDRTDVTKFLYPSIGDEHECDVCKKVIERTKEGVSIEELKKIIKEESSISRGLVIHPNCRHTFIRKFGDKKGWETR